jgi:hypothetical protein
MLIDHPIARRKLEEAIVSDPDLYAQFDEQRLLNNGYTTEQLRSMIIEWIAAGDECAACA